MRGLFYIDIELFPTIAKTKSFSQASKVLHLSRPALSNKINNLESYYGLEFYKRSFQGVTLTEAGRIVTDYAMRFLELRNSMESELLTLKQNYNPDLCIGASSDVGNYALPFNINTFKFYCPNASVSLSIGKTQDMIDKVRDQTVDLAIVEGTIDEQDLKIYLMDSCEMVLLVPNLLSWKHLKYPTIDDLLNRPLIIRDKDTNHYHILDKYFRQQGYELSDFNVCAMINSYPAMINAIQSGIGMGFVPSNVARFYINDGQVRQINLRSGPIEIKYNLIYSKLRELSTYAEAFMDYLLNASDGHLQWGLDTVPYKANPKNA